MKRSHLRLASVLGAAAISAVAVAPAVAATTVSQAGANALNLSIAGNGQGTGNVTATNNGTKETKSGDSVPSIGLLQNQQLINAGVLAQDATAQVKNRVGTSAACAGLAGNGASVVRIGDSGCLDPGQPLDIAFANLDLSNTLVVDPASALAPLAQANEPLALLLGSITKPLADAVASTPLGPTGLSGTLGAVEGSCLARPGSASGDANIVDTKLTLNVAGTEVVLAELPARPAPNTDVPVNLDKATEVILGAVETNLRNSLNGSLAPLTALTDALQNQVIKAVVDATRAQLLTPLRDNVISIVLNQQTRTGADAIKVRALDLQLLPAAKQFGVDSLVGLQIGNVACGPNGRVVAADRPAPVDEPADIPTAVSAGYATAPAGTASGDDSHNDVVLAAFAVMLLGGTALVGFRRLHD